MSAVVAAAAEPSVSPAKTASPQGRSWTEIARLPDLVSGIWEIGPGNGRFGLQMPPTPLLTPAYLARVNAYERAQVEDTPNANCVPPGMPGIMSPPFPLQFLFSPGQVVMIFEAYTQVRYIFTDGRTHPQDPDASYNGHSIGHWEGSTLVVDTVAISTDTPLSSHPLEQNYGMRHSAKLHIIERMRLTDAETLMVDTVIEDPEALAAPWRYARMFKRHRDWTLSEYVCNENNRNYVDENGRAGIILTPPDTLAEKPTKKP